MTKRTDSNRDGLQDSLDPACGGNPRVRRYVRHLRAATILVIALVNGVLVFQATDAQTPSSNSQAQEGGGQGVDRRDDRAMPGPAVSSAPLKFWNAVRARELRTAGDILDGLRQTASDPAQREAMEPLEDVYEHALNFWQLVAVGRQTLRPGTELYWRERPLALVVENNDERFVIRVPGRSIACEVDQVGDTTVLRNAPAPVALALAALASQANQAGGSLSVAVFASATPGMKTDDIAKYWERARQVAPDDKARSQVESLARFVQRLSGESSLADRDSSPPVSAGVARVDMGQAGQENLSPGEQAKHVTILEMQLNTADVDDEVDLALIRPNAVEEKESGVRMLRKSQSSWQAVIVMDGGEVPLATFDLVESRIFVHWAPELSRDERAAVTSRVLRVTAGDRSEYLLPAGPRALPAIPVSLSEGPTRTVLLPSLRPGIPGVRLHITRLEGCDGIIRDADQPRTIEMDRKLDLKLANVEDAGVEVVFDEYEKDLRLTLQPYFCLPGSKRRLPLTRAELAERVSTIQQSIDEALVAVTQLQSYASQVTASRDRIAKRKVPSGPVISAATIRKAQQLEAANRELAATAQRIASLEAATAKERNDVDRLLKLTQAMETLSGSARIYVEITCELASIEPAPSIVIARTGR